MQEQELEDELEVGQEQQVEELDRQDKESELVDDGGAAEEEKKKQDSSSSSSSSAEFTSWSSPARNGLAANPTCFLALALIFFWRNLLSRNFSTASEVLNTTSA